MIVYLEDINKYPLKFKESPLWWHKKGLLYTATGYGKKIPTSKMVKYNNRWHRIYCHIYSNSGSLYIISKGQRIYLKYGY